MRTSIVPMGTVVYNDDAAYGELRLGRGFFEGHRIDQLDFLQGLQAEVCWLYEYMLSPAFTGEKMTREQYQDFIKRVRKCESISIDKPKN